MKLHDTLTRLCLEKRERLKSFLAEIQEEIKRDLKFMAGLAEL